MEASNFLERPLGAIKVAIAKNLTRTLGCQVKSSQVVVDARDAGGRLEVSFTARLPVGVDASAACIKLGEPGFARGVAAHLADTESSEGLLGRCHCKLEASFTAGLLTVELEGPSSSCSGDSVCARLLLGGSISKISDLEVCFDSAGHTSYQTHKCQIETLRECVRRLCTLVQG